MLVQAFVVAVGLVACVVEASGGVAYVVGASVGSSAVAAGVWVAGTFAGTVVGTEAEGLDGMASAEVGDSAAAEAGYISVRAPLDEQRESKGRLGPVGSPVAAHGVMVGQPSIVVVWKAALQV